ncbi:MAG: PQQ-binding-like beta-propeller repeat protein [bacterium]
MRRIGIISLLPFLFALNVCGADWPTYRADAARSGYTSENLPMGLHLQWTYKSAHAPQPAWTAPDSRMPFDHVYHPVVAEGMLYFGSSSDCKVYSLDAKSGKERWTVFTGAPVRLAPVVWEHRVYAVSDDSCLYCLDAGNGSVLWKKRGNPSTSMVLGNDRMISRWSARGGPAILDGVLYYSVGIWPSEGIYLYALDARTGEQLWLNDSAGGIEMNQPHPTARAKSGVSCQGYLVATGNRLLIPTGRAVPAAFDRRSGDLLFFHLQQYGHNGGSPITASQDFFFNAGCAYQTNDGAQALKLQGSQVVVTPDGVIQGDSRQIGLYTWVDAEKTDKRGNTILVKDLKEMWAVETECAGISLIAAGDTIVSGAQNRICLIDQQAKKLFGPRKWTDSRTDWRLQTDGFISAPTRDSFTALARMR